jgi:pantoate--beta-alanine ligase
VRRINHPAEFQTLCDELRRSGSLGFVPTMGALHDGHLALVCEAKRRAQHVAVSIFVNPAQFGPNEDLARYPRDLDGDLDKCQRAGADVVFIPDPESMYLPGDATRVRVGGLSEELCGAQRPGHFDGVCTVVAKLFALSGECTAVFGRKDYQQWKVIERLVADLFLKITVVGHPIVREADGLAMSSRNRYLEPAERQSALSLSRGLSRAAEAFVAGERSPRALEALLRDSLVSAGAVIEYVSCAHPEHLRRFEDVERPERGLLAVAAFVGKTRLIDNRVVTPSGASEEAAR